MEDRPEFQGTERFRLLSRIGFGGMGIVYHAFDRERKTRVALKTVRHNDPNLLIRLKREFRAVQGLHHPNLVNFGELCEHEGHWFFTMEIVEGIDFLTYIRDGEVGEDDPCTPTSRIHEAMDHPIPSHQDRFEIKDPAQDSSPKPGELDFDEERLRSSLAQLAQAIYALNSIGKVHRDIKPSNILVTQEGRLVLLDFGLVTTAGSFEQDNFGDDEQSTGRHALGTYVYMAPEQGAGKPVDEKADWYSFGVMLYEALAGTTPQSGNGIEILIEKQLREPEAPSTYREDIPEDLNSLCMDLLRCDPEQRPGGREILRRLHVDIHAARDSSRGSNFTTRGSDIFVGRMAELNQLREALDERPNNNALMVMISGEAGIGKTALIQHFLQEAQARPTPPLILRGRCLEQESVPYKALDGVIDGLSRYLNRIDHASAAALMPRRIGLLAQVFPVLKRVQAIKRVPESTEDSSSPQEKRSRVFSAMRELFLRIADRQTVIITIDDLHWSDADSIAMMSELLRPPDAPKLLILASLRSSYELELSSLILPYTQRITLKPLSKQESLPLAAKLLSAIDSKVDLDIEELVSAAEGHPLFINELVHHSTSRHHSIKGPMRLDDALIAHVEQLDSEPQMILEMLAIAGIPVTYDLIGDATGLSPNIVAKQASALRIARLVRHRGRDKIIRAELYHNRVREALVGHLSEEKRKQLHKQFATCFETCPDAEPETLAAQWEGAGNPQRAAYYALQAGDQLCTAFSFTRASDLYQHALDLGTDNADVILAIRKKLASALANAGRGEEAAKVFDTVSESVNPSVANDFRRQAADQYFASGHVVEGVRVLAEVMADYNLAFPKSAAAALTSLLRSRTRLKFTSTKFRERSSQDIAPAELSRIDIYWSGTLGLSSVDVIRGADFSARHLLLALQCGEPSRICRAFAQEAVHLASQGGSRKRIGRYLESAASLASRIKDPMLSAMVRSEAGWTKSMQGEWDEALSLFMSAEQMLRRLSDRSSWWLNHTRLGVVTTLWQLGRYRKLAHLAPQFWLEAQDTGDLYGWTSFQIGISNFIWLMQDDPIVAREVSQDALAHWTNAGYHVQHGLDLLSQTMIDFYLGDPLSAHERFNENWLPLEKSHLLRVQLLRIIMNYARGCAAVAAVQLMPSRKKELMRVAKTCLKTLRTEKAAWSKGLTSLLGAQIAYARGHHAKAIQLLRNSMIESEHCSMAGFTDVARRRLGQLVGGDEGRACTEAADAWMNSQGICSPECITRTLAPGFPD